MVKGFARLRDKLAGRGGGERVVVVVSGLPRSGTSMMMKMLEAGGIQPLTDNVREANIDNPEGYYEFERVKALDKGDIVWLEDAVGRSVKVISALLKHLPEGYTYKVLFMRRKLPEILASQKKMLERRGRDPNEASDEELTELFMKHIAHVQSWAEGASNVHYLEVSYNDLVADPVREIGAIQRFIGRDLDTERMIEVVNPELYRNRADKLAQS